jgi:hypothetical protein
MISEQQLLLVIILVILLLVITRRRKFSAENYLKQPANLDDIMKLVDDKGRIRFYPYDHSTPRNYILERNGDTVRFKGQFLGVNKKKYYISVKDNTTPHITSTKKPVGNVDFKIMKSITDSADGYYSIKVADNDSQVYMFLDPLTNEGGFIDLKDNEMLKGINNPIALNFHFATPGKSGASVPALDASEYI